MMAVLSKAVFSALAIGCGLVAIGDVHHERIEWCDTWIPMATEQDLPRVLLVGDSITKGYYNAVVKRLSGQAYVARLATSRSVCDPLYIAELRPVVEGYDWSVIHFNNGLHGTAYTEAEYRAGMSRTLQYLKKEASNAQIIGVFSTPLRPGTKLGGFENRISKRNDILRQLCTEMKLPVNDLYTPMLEFGEYYRDTHHFKGKAIDRQADQVAKTILTALKKEEK